MRRQDAVDKLVKLLGKNMGYRVDPKAPDADEREEAKAELQMVQVATDEASRRMNKRRVELLTDPEYQRLLAEYKALSKRREQLTGKMHHYRFTVGHNTGLFFMVKAQGDSWEEVLAKLAADKKKAST